VYPNCKLYGIDFIDNYDIKKLSDKLPLKFQVCNIQSEQIPFVKKFSLIILTEVLEHFNTYCVPTLTTIIDSLDDGGYLFLSTPNSDIWGKINYKHYSELPLISDNYIDNHIYQFNTEEIIEILNILNLKTIVLTTNTHGHINGIFKKGDL
jgi:2-polyprenyl-3-methyl-5-hydroxy-6-metoxy-1,4-benzoquinol methylase